MNAITYRPSDPEDLNFVVATYNEVIAEGGLTADTSPYTISDKTAWFAEVNTHPCRLFVVCADGHPIGYFYFSFWRKGRKALNKTAEITYYLQRLWRRKGIGGQIIQWCEQEAAIAGFSQLLAVMLDINQGSRTLLERHGFIRAGHLQRVAQLGTLECGQFIYQKSISGWLAPAGSGNGNCPAPK